MKRIGKGAEPRQFSIWKKQDRMSHLPRWNRVSAAIRKSIHESLMREQGFICCYCESRIAMDDSHIEHFRPKTKFPDRQLDYENLHCSCQRDLSRGEPRHCGHRKGSWFDEKLLLSPLEADCEDRFRFTANGDVFPRSANDAAAKTSIKKLGLDLPKFRALRAAAIDALHTASSKEIERLLERRMDEPLLEFHTTIAQVLSNRSHPGCAQAAHRRGSGSPARC